jgi:tetratricopeptide (TPR) repeat protein
MMRRKFALGKPCADALTFAWLLITIAGCSTTPGPSATADSTLSRYARDGREAYDEGRVDEAIKKYDRALMRAWAIDDPYESGTVAYNLAACLSSRARYVEAADWLVDSRVELCRAQSSTGNTWLLSAEIAMARQQFDDAKKFVDYASRTCPPCEVVQSSCLCGPSSDCSDEKCKECCIVKLPCIGKKIRSKQQSQDCEQTYQARIELARARLAAKQGDASCAKSHLQVACDLTSDLCDDAFDADRHDVAAMVHDLEGKFLQAGAHRDREIELLRRIGHYRQIPDVLDDAARSYQRCDRFDLAVDRIIRSARIWLARGELEQAWQRIRNASELSVGRPSQAVEIRLALTAKRIQDAIDKKEGMSLGGDDLESPEVPTSLDRSNESKSELTSNDSSSVASEDSLAELISRFGQAD